jgi:hypothetical protein
MSARYGFRNGLTVAAAVGLLAVAGCASQPRPDAEITRARTLIEQAEKAGAQRYAAVELDQARNKLRLANAAAEDGKQDEARARANEAAADAELAVARSQSGEARRAAEEVEKSNDTLQRETERTPVNAPAPAPAPPVPTTTLPTPPPPPAPVTPPPQSPNTP